MTLSDSKEVNVMRARNIRGPLDVRIHSMGKIRNQYQGPGLYDCQRLRLVKPPGHGLILTAIDREVFPEDCTPVLAVAVIAAALEDVRRLRGLSEATRSGS